MFQIHIAKSVSEKKYNEDTFSYGSSYAMVLDGASGLDKADHMHTGSDAKWFAECMQAEIQKRIQNPVPLRQIVAESIQVLIPLYPVVHKSFMPSGCLSLLRVRDDTIEYIGFGDTVALVKTKTEVLELYDHKIGDLDQIAIDAMKNSSRKEVQPILIENRKLRNTPGGYCALDLTMDSLDYCIERSWKKEDVQSVALMSDGFFQYKSFLKQTPEEFMQTLYEQKEKALQVLDSFQENDWQCLELPRLKKKDDTTILFFSLQF